MGSFPSLFLFLFSVCVCPDVLVVFVRDHAATGNPSTKKMAGQDRDPSNGKSQITSKPVSGRVLLKLSQRDNEGERSYVRMVLGEQLLSSSCVLAKPALMQLPTKKLPADCRISHNIVGSRRETDWKGRVWRESFSEGVADLSC